MMKCKKCGRQINITDAYHCSECGGDYCKVCSDNVGYCECGSDFNHYS